MFRSRRILVTLGEDFHRFLWQENGFGLIFHQQRVWTYLKVEVALQFISFATLRMLPPLLFACSVPLEDGLIAARAILLPHMTCALEPVGGPPAQLLCPMGSPPRM